jgi:taurine--2-oxoglutarate transaminase
MKAIERFLLDRGVYTMVRWWSVMTNPPLCIDEAQLAEAFEVLDEALEIGDRAVRG